MKKIILLLLLVFPLMVIAQPSEKDLEKHKKAVQRSKEKGKVVCSLK